MTLHLQYFSWYHHISPKIRFSLENLARIFQRLLKNESPGLAWNETPCIFNRLRGLQSLFPVQKLFTLMSTITCLTLLRQFRISCIIINCSKLCLTMQLSYKLYHGFLLYISFNLTTDLHLGRDLLTSWNYLIQISLTICTQYKAPPIFPEVTSIVHSKNRNRGLLSRICIWNPFQMTPGTLLMLISWNCWNSE